MLLKNQLREWRGSLRQKEAADILDLPLPTYRKYEYGKRTPNKLAMAELQRRMIETNGDKIIKQRHFAARGNQITGFLTTEDKEE